MKIGDLVKVSFKGRKPVTVKITGFPTIGKCTVVFLRDETRHITIDTKRIEKE